MAPKKKTPPEKRKRPPRRKEGAGRPESAPTWHQRRTLLDVIEVTGSDVTACLKARVPRSTFYLWLQKGRQDRETGQESYWTEFLDRIEEARADRVYKLEALVRDDALKERRAESAKWKLERIAPKQYGQRVRIQVEEELSEAIERVEERFRDRPELLEEILATLAGAHGAGEASDSPEAEGGAEHPDGAPVHPALPVPETNPVPESDV